MMITFSLFILLIIGGTCGRIPRLGRESYYLNEQKQGVREGEYLLPTDLEPLEYDVSIIPYLETPTDKSFTFDGHVNVLLNVTASTTIVRLHAFNLSIVNETLTIKAVNQSTPEVIRSWLLSTDDKQFFSIYVSKALEVGRLYTLDVDFSGWLKDDLVGFYRSSYIDNTGITKWMGVTFFEAPYARQAFPCWDEPIWRANFTLHVAHAPGQTATANMPTDGPETPVENRPELDGWMWTHFEPSVSMSTYLVAFAVSNFMNTPGDSLQSAWSRPEAQNQCEYGLSIAPSTITYMEEFTNQIYSLPKLDHIALPDFIAGAMENWGLITYRETAFLFQDGISSSANLQRVATVIAHEVAHQWFGNLVSPKWWNSIWLNEAFATYFEFHIMESLEPTWGMVQQFVLEEMYASLLSDAFETTHPVVDDVENPAGPTAVFDGLAYTKGGPIVRFIAHLMGSEQFQYGIWDYMATNAYKNADTEDLFASLEKFMPPNILPHNATLGAMLRPWLHQAGYPVLNVTRDYNDSTKTARITQERFVFYPTGSLPLDELWPIPITLTSSYDIDFEDFSIQEWLEDTEISLPLQATADQWILLNVQQTGFYRVNYDARNWALLLDALHNPIVRDQFHPINRAQLMDDAFALARAGYLDYNIALDMTSYMSDEIMYAPWAAVLGAFSFLYDRFNYEDHSRGLLEWYTLNQMQLVYSDVGGVTYNSTSDEEHLHKMLRMLILRWACEMGHQQCRDDSTALYNLWTTERYPDKTNPIAPDLRYVAYCSGMRYGDQSDYDFLYYRYGNATNFAGEQEVILKSMACASDTKLLEQLLFESIAPDSMVRYQDAKNVYTWVYSNRYGVDLALDFLIAYYPEAAIAYGGMGTVGGLFAGLATKLNTQSQRDKLEEFRAQNEDQLGDALGGVDAALITVDQNMQWHNDYYEEVVSYLENSRGNAASIVTFSLNIFALSFAVMSFIVTLN